MPAMTPIEFHYTEWDPVPRKDGTLGRRLQSRPVRFCPLYACERCSRRGGGHQVQYRSLLARQLCMGCWNRLRGLARMQDEIDDIARLTRKLARTKRADING